MRWRIHVDRAPFWEASATLPPQELERLEDELVLLVKRLPRRFQSPFLLRYVHGKAIPEIARQLHLSETRVFHRMKQATHRLRVGVSDGCALPGPPSPTAGMAFIPRDDLPVELGSVSGKNGSAAVSWLFQRLRLRRQS
jgi:hypothetical protein